MDSFKVHCQINLDKKATSRLVSDRPVTRGVHGVHLYPRPTGPKGPQFDTQYPS